MYIDTHCHLMMEHFSEDLPMVIGNAKKAGVKQMVCPGVDLFSSRLAASMTHKYPGAVFAAVGFHPYEAQHNPSVHEIEQLVKTQKNIVAIGEIGLDYHMYKGEQAAGKKQSQKILFEEQLRLALAYDLPAVMHCREAFEDFFSVLDGLPTMPRGVIHCFSGGLQEVRMAAERKLYMGVDGNVTYSKQLATVITHIPLSMLLLETDAPYLTPVPHRGERNEPKYIPLVAQKTAQLLGETVELIAEQTTANARNFFRLPA